MKKRGLALTAVLLSLALLTASCGGSGAENAGGSAAVTEEASAEKCGEDSGADKASDAVQIQLDGTEAEIDGEGASLSDGILTISSAGTYTLSGTFEGQVLIDPGEDSEVTLILDGVNITTDGTYAVCAVDGKKLTVTLADGSENTLNVSGVNTEEDAETEEEKADAAVYAKNDLVLTGDGALTVSAAGKAFHTKDTLLVESGTWTITSADDAFNGKDSVEVEDGTFDVTITDTETGKGITSRGDVTLNGGTFTLHASNEGVEGLTVTVNGGTWSLAADDDGINGREKAEDSDSAEDSAGSAAESGTGDTAGGAAAESGAGDSAGGRMGARNDEASEREKMEYNEKVLVTINGGLVTIDAGGDGIDSNGDILLNGGEVYVSGSVRSMDSALDPNGTTTVNGGTLLASGMQGMMEGISDSSGQAVLTVYCDTSLAAGTLVSVTDDSGTEVVSWTVPKECNVLQISSAAFEDGKTFTVKTGENSEEVQISGTSTTLGTAQQGRSFGGMTGGGPGRGQGGPAGGGPAGDSPSGSGPAGGGPAGGPAGDDSAGGPMGKASDAGGSGGAQGSGRPAPSGDMTPPEREGSEGAAVSS